MSTDSSLAHIASYMIPHPFVTNTSTFATKSTLMLCYAAIYTEQCSPYNVIHPTSFLTAQPVYIAWPRGSFPRLACSNMPQRHVRLAPNVLLVRPTSFRSLDKLSTHNNRPRLQVWTALPCSRRVHAVQGRLSQGKYIGKP